MSWIPTFSLLALSVLIIHAFPARADAPRVWNILNFATGKCIVAKEIDADSATPEAYDHNLRAEGITDDVHVEKLMTEEHSSSASPSCNRAVQ